MTRIKIEEIKGITAERKRSACAAGDNAASIEKEASEHCCSGDECHIDWHED